MIKVLSIDGGGIRGVIPALVLSKIEELTGNPIASLFNMIAGTSAGGILAAGLTMPGPDGNPKHTAADLADLYIEKGAEIFSSSVWQKVISAGGLFAEKYSAARLEQVLTEYLSSANLQDALTDLLVTGYEIEQRKLWFFRSWKAKKHPANRDFPLRDVARATSAAPTYFAPARIDTNRSRDYLSLVDGGVFANNPSMCAYVEARNKYKEQLAAGEDILLVSIGTGRSRESILYGKRIGWGLIRWVRPILNVVFDGVSRVVDYQLEQLLNNDQVRYYRFQTDLQKARSSLADGASRRYIRLLRADAQNLLDTQQRKLREVCKILVS